MLAATVNAEFADDVTAQAVVRDHSFDGIEDHFVSAPGVAHFLGGCFMVTTNEPCEPVVFLFHFFLAGQDDLISVDDDNEVTTINVWGKDGFVFAAEDYGGMHSNITQHSVGCVDHIPFAFDVYGFGGKGLHSGGCF